MKDVNKLTKYAHSDWLCMGLQAAKHKFAVIILC